MLCYFGQSSAKTFIRDKTDPVGFKICYIWDSHWLQ